MTTQELKSTLENYGLENLTSKTCIKVDNGNLNFFENNRPCLEVEENETSVGLDLVVFYVFEEGCYEYDETELNHVVKDINLFLN